MSSQIFVILGDPPQPLFVPTEGTNCFGCCGYAEPSPIKEILCRLWLYKIKPMLKSPDPNQHAFVFNLLIVFYYDLVRLQDNLVGDKSEYII